MVTLGSEKLLSALVVVVAAVPMGKEGDSRKDCTTLLFSSFCPGHFFRVPRVALPLFFTPPPACFAFHSLTRSSKSPFCARSRPSPRPSLPNDYAATKQQSAVGSIDSLGPASNWTAKSDQEEVKMRVGIVSGGGEEERKKPLLPDCNLHLPHSLTSRQILNARKV